jgi:hypothetical protein
MTMTFSICATFKKVFLILFLVVSTLSFAAEKETKEVKEKGNVMVRGPGDFTHDRGPRGRSNVRLREGETHTFRVDPGDKIIRETPTLPDAKTKLK